MSARAHEMAKDLIAFHCPGCRYDHAVGVHGRKIPGEDGTMNTWQWNDSLEQPTFTPSLLVFKNTPSARCHSFVTSGRIQFLQDSFHTLKGQTVELPDWEGW
jgi:hypothetical protein